MGKFAPALTALVVALAVAPAWAADPWPSDGQNQFNYRYGGGEGPPASRAANLTPEWSRTFDSPVVGTPIVADNGGVYVATENGEVWGIRRTDGVKYWEQFVPGQIEGSVLKGPNAVYAVSSVPSQNSDSPAGAYLDAFDPISGNVKWRTQLDPNPDADSCGGPQYSATHDAVIVGLGACRAERTHTSSNMRGAIASVNATTGALNWKTNTVSPLATGGGVSGTPIVWDGGDKAFVTTGHAYGSVADPNTDAFLRLNLTTGGIDGVFQINAGDTSSNGTLDPGKRVGFSTSSPVAFAANDNKSYLGAGAGDGKFHIIDPLTMTDRFATQLAAPGDAAGIPSSAAWNPYTQLINGVTQSPSVFFAIAQSQGKLAWIFPGADLLHRGPVSVAGGAIWSTDETGFVDVQDQGNGSTLGRYPIGGPSVAGVSFWAGKAIVGVGVPSGLIPGAPATGGLYALR